MSNWAMIGFEVLAAGGAIGILASRQVLHAAMYLLVTLLAVAGIFSLYGAEFLFVAQIMIYAGGILVLMVMGIMVTSHTQPAREVHSSSLPPTAFSALVLFAFLAVALTAFANPPPPADQAVATAQAVGHALISTYALPFEVAAILLLITLVGAAVVASDKQHTR